MPTHDDDAQNLDLDQLLGEIRRRVRSRVGVTAVSNDPYPSEPADAKQPLAANPHAPSPFWPGAPKSGQRGQTDRRSLTERLKADRSGIERVRTLGLQIGQLPPTPPTLRARMGRVLVKFVTRCLWWNLAQIESLAAACVQALHDQADFGDRVAAAMQGVAQRASLDAEIEAREAVEVRLGVEAARIDQTVAAHVRDHEDLLAHILRLERKLAEAEQHLELANQTSHRLVRDLVLVDRRLSLLSEEARGRLPATYDVEQLTDLAKREDHKLDSLYLAFEDAFRGSRDLVRNRQRVYLPYLEAAGIGGPEMPLLDVGCGRGEWLELLRDAGLHAQGIDRNLAMVALCQELGLDVRPADLGEYLSGVPDASLGAVTLSHVVEHLPYRLVIALLDEVLRALKPGGMLILETPNPQNIQVGAHTFYTDPTHRNPLPSSMLKFLVEARGFTGVQVLSLSPYPVGEAVPEDSELARRFNAYFYGAQDYAVIARKT
jgi:O-antigen chain-terminating methyltransferase